MLEITITNSYCNDINGTLNNLFDATVEVKLVNVHYHYIKSLVLAIFPSKIWVMIMKKKKNHDN